MGQVPIGPRVTIELAIVTEHNTFVEIAAEAACFAGGSLGGSDEGGLGLLRTALKALLSTDTIGAICFVLVEVV